MNNRSQISNCRSYTEDEIRNMVYTGSVCSFELRIGSNPSKYNIDTVEDSLVFFINDENGTAEEHLSEYIQDAENWYANGHEGIELYEDQWLEYSCRRYTGYEDGHVDLYNSYGHYSEPFE